jgi:multisubunit Na+/H+ antiporter MnhG subunit
MKEDLMMKFSNQSMGRLFKITFIIAIMFLLNPFVAYLVFKNKGALEVTFIHLL